MSRSHARRGLPLAACMLAGTTMGWAADPGTAPGKLVVVARQHSRGIKVAYRAAGHGVERSEGWTGMRLEVRSVNDPVPAALAVVTGVRDGAGARGALLGDGLAPAPAPDRDSARPPGAISTIACARGAAEDTCHCTTFPDCVRRVVGAGTGTKLVCRRGGTALDCAPERIRCFGGPGCVLDARRRDDGVGVEFIVCAGDSNTVEAKKPLWCGRLGEWLGPVETVTTGWAGSRASPDPGHFQHGVVSARAYLTKMLGWARRPDMVILAWGTNDVPVHTAEDVADAIDVLVQRMRRAGVVPLVATVPWFSGAFSVHNSKVDALNGLLAVRHGPCLVDLTTITPPSATWYSDRRHLNHAAQERRAIAAYYALQTLPRSCAAGVVSWRP